MGWGRQARTAATRPASAGAAGTTASQAATGVNQRPAGCRWLAGAQGQGSGRWAGRGAGRGCCAWCCARLETARTPAPTTSLADGMIQRGQGRGRGSGAVASMGMSGEEHEAIWKLLDNRKDISRAVEELPNGVKTTTTSTIPELVAVIRSHARAMAGRLEEDRPVRLWDPVFADVFAHAKEIQLSVTDIEGGVAVIETSDNPKVIPMIRAHAKAVSRFLAEGHAAVRPPWAGGRGR